MAEGVIREHGEKVLLGILLTTLSYMLFTFHDAVIKLLVVTFSVWQILFFRSATIVAGSLLFGGGRTLLRQSLTSPIVVPMALRTVIIVAAWVCYYNAARRLQLAELTTIYYAAPIIVTVLSIVVLGEKVPATRWLAVMVGFAGVFVACNPAGIGFTVPVLLVLSAAFLWGLSIVLLRKIALQEKTLIQLVLNNGFSMLAAVASLPFLWVTPGVLDTVLMLAAGMVAGIAQFLLFEGMKRAPASIIAPIEYTSLIWAFLLGYAVWGDIPRPAVFAGAALILLAGLLIVAGEQRRRTR